MDGMILALAGLPFFIFWLGKQQQKLLFPTRGLLGTFFSGTTVLGIVIGKLFSANPMIGRELIYYTFGRVGCAFFYN